MSETNKEPTEETKTKAQRSSEIKRAYRIRQKPESERTDADKEWLANYDSTKLRRGKIAVEANEQPEIETPEVDTEDFAAPPPPTPPRIETNAGNRDDGGDNAKTVSSGGDWRNQYRKQGKDAGRQRTVETIAGGWRDILAYVSGQIVMSGGTPMFDVNMLWPHLVMTVDDFLPEKVQIKPSHIAAVGTTVLLTQRIARQKKITEAYERGVKHPLEPRPADTNVVKGPWPESTPPPKGDMTANEAQEVLKKAGLINDNPAPQAEPPAEPAQPPPVINIAPDIAVEFKPGPTDVY